MTCSLFHRRSVLTQRSFGSTSLSDRTFGSDDQAWYQNDDTGVYFSFELAATPSFWAQFIVNHMRPRFFILEALPEIESFVSTFGLTVHDPQIDGMGDGRFDSDGFIRGWAAGNETACATLAESGHPPPVAMSSDRLEASGAGISAAGCARQSWAKPCSCLKSCSRPTRGRRARLWSGPTLFRFSSPRSTKLFCIAMRTHPNGSFVVSRMFP